MSNENDLVVIKRGDVEALKQEAIFGVFRRDAVEWDKLSALLSSVNEQEAVWIVKRDSKSILTGLSTSIDVSAMPDGTKLFTYPPDASATIAKLQREVEELKADAERYRNLKALALGAQTTRAFAISKFDGFDLEWI